MHNLFSNRSEIVLCWLFCSRADCDAPCFELLKATHLRAPAKQQALLDVLLQLIKRWPLTIGPCFYISNISSNGHSFWTIVKRSNFLIKNVGEDIFLQEREKWGMLASNTLSFFCIISKFIHKKIFQKQYVLIWYSWIMFNFRNYLCKRAKKPTSQKLIIETDPLSCPFHTFLLFLDALAQKKYVYLGILLRLA